MRFLRLGRPIPPFHTAAGLTFWLRWDVVMSLVSLVTGIVYATGIAQNGRWLGVSLLLVGVAYLHSARSMARLRNRVRAGATDPPDIANPS
jgi:hypothetical protein